MADPSASPEVPPPPSPPAGAPAASRPGWPRVLAETAAAFAPLFLAAWLVQDARTSRALAGLVGSTAVLASLGVVTWLLRREGRGWAAYGMLRSPNWARSTGLALALVLVTLVVVAALRFALAGVGAEPPDYSRFSAIRGNLELLTFTLGAAWITAAFGEEMLVRGFLMNRLAAAWGGSAAGWGAALISSSFFFGLAHFYQGPSGMLLTGVIGILFGGVYLAVGRNLWVTVLAHGAVDTISLVALYAGWA